MDSNSLSEIQASQDQGKDQDSYMDKDPSTADGIGSSGWRKVYPSCGVGTEAVFWSGYRLCLGWDLQRDKISNGEV